MKHYCSFTRALCFAATMAAAGPARAESLADAISLAYAHNPNLVGQRLTQQATDENYVQARAQYGPSITITGQGTFQRLNQPAQSATGAIVRNVANSNAGQLVGGINQPLYTAGRLRGQLLSAKAQVLSGRETLRNAEQQVVQNTISVYAAVLRDQLRVEVGRQNVAVLREQLIENRERYSRVGGGVGAGDVTLTDIGLSDSRLANAQITLANLESQLAISRAQYLEVVGQNPGTLDPIPALPGVPRSVDEAFATAERRNPGLLASKYAEQSASANVAFIRGELGPTVSLAAQGIYSNRIAPFSGQLGTREFVGGVTITQNIFSGGQVRSRVRQARAQDGAAQAAVDQQRRITVEAVTEAWSNLASARVALEAGQRQVVSAQLAYAGMHREELEGLRSTLDTLNAEQELVNAQLTLLENRYEEHVLEAQLLASVGVLQADDLVDHLDRYDPAVHFDRVKNNGRTVLEPVVALLDRLGSANPRQPLAADLNGIDSPVPDAMPALPPRPGPAVLQGALTPITESRLVPASELPGGLPPAPDLPAAAGTAAAPR